VTFVIQLFSFLSFFFQLVLIARFLLHYSVIQTIQAPTHLKLHRLYRLD
jgi:hypothetical protein